MCKPDKADYAAVEILKECRRQLHANMLLTNRRRRRWYYKLLNAECHLMRMDICLYETCTHIASQ